jgi:putative flippase GtrA
MQTPAPPTELFDAGQIARYLLNGATASAVHFATLWFNLRILEMPTVGIANLCAAVVGLSASFLGSRYFVFRRQRQPILPQAARFGLLYAGIACLHGAVLYAWSDLARLDYRAGFVLATALQMVLSYLGNKRMVFRA